MRGVATSARFGWALLLALLIAAAVAWTRRAEAQLLSPGPLSQAHASLEGDQHCSDCHASGKRIEGSLCLKCHGDLGARISAGQGLHGREFKGQPCEKCHVEHHGAGAHLVRWPGGARESLDHAQTGWPLEGAHHGVGCDTCHTKTNSRGAHTYLGLSNACSSCHKDPHAGRFGATCTTCHDQTRWQSVKLSSFNHDLARFQLRGAHQRTPCTSCHTGQPAKYTGLTFAACSDCHKDPHRGRLGGKCSGCHEESAWSKVSFSRGAHPGVSLGGGHAAVRCGACHDKGNLAAPSRGTECVSCHRPVHKAPFGRACGTCHARIEWLGLPRAVGLAAHARTAYPLTGRHEKMDCAACHKPALAENTRFRGLHFERCLDCHKDQHQGEFAELRQGECSPCHTTGGFRPTLFGADAHQKTKFALDGMHLGVACIGCHTEPRPRVSLHVAKQACADCHQNPHGEQFATEMRDGGCAHCHVTAGWKRAKFDHSTWPLTGAHATANCESCHHPTAEDRKQGRGASYRGVPRACDGCHDDAHVGQFRASQPVKSCDRCHSTRLFKIPQFDHTALTAFALTGAHERVECAKCHVKERLTSGAEAVRYRLPSHECSDCHKNPHGGAR